MSQNPKIPGQRGPQSVTHKAIKAPTTFQPEYVNDSLELSGPTNGRPGKLSQYTQDLLVYVGALEAEVTGLRDKQDKFGEKITGLNGTITALKGQITANHEQHQRALATAKSATRTANATMDAERSKANAFETTLKLVQNVHELFGRAAIETLNYITTGGVKTLTSYFTCGGLYLTHGITHGKRFITVASARTNPIKLREHRIDRFAGDDLLMPDKTYLLFLREAATVEGYGENKNRLSDSELDRLYDLEAINRKFGCGHTAIQHIEMREQLLKRFAPAIVTVVFKRLESHDSTNDHQIELTRAIMVAAGLNEDTANAMAKAQSEGLDQLNRAKQKLRNESIDPELAKTLGETALSGMMDFEALDLRPENLRLKPTSASEALRRLHKHNGQYLFGTTPGRHDLISPIIREYNRESIGYAAFNWDNFREFPKGDTHDLGTDSLYDVPGGQPCVDGRPTQAAEPKPDHSGECRNNGFSDSCTHPDHQPKG